MLLTFEYWHVSRICLCEGFQGLLGEIFGSNAHALTSYYRELFILANHPHDEMDRIN